MLRDWMRLPGVERGEEAEGLNRGVLQYLKSRNGKRKKEGREEVKRRKE